MSEWTNNTISRCFPAALFQLGYEREDTVIVLCFDDVVERVQINGKDPVIGDLKSGMVRIFNF